MNRKYTADEYLETIEKIQFNELNILGNKLYFFTVSLFPNFLLRAEEEIGCLSVFASKSAPPYILKVITYLIKAIYSSLRSVYSLI